MKFAYLILAHKNPKQLARLVSRLNTSDALFFIHIDKKTDPKPFEQALSTIHSANWYFVKKRQTIVWGGFNMVRATLNGLKEIVALQEAVSHVTLLSGQDYPIQSAEEYQAYLLQHQHKTFIEYFPIPTIEIAHGGLDRLSYYHIVLTRKLHFALPLISFLKVRSAHAKQGKWLLIKRIVSVLPSAKPYPRKFIPNATPYYGSQWCTLSMEAVKYIVSSLDKDKQFYDYFKYTHIPDELFFQSLLLNAPQKSIRENIINNSLHYINWGNPRTDHPENITLKDMEAILASGKFIARKFEAEDDMKVLDQFDEMIAMKTSKRDSEHL
jgi:hypothetical protein